MAKVRVATNAVSHLYGVVVSGNQKAIVAFVLAAVAGLGLQVNGVNLLDASVREVVVAVVSGLVSSVGVWLKANK